MHIGQLARQAGVTPDTIRYYEREGVLPSPARLESRYRSYGQHDVVRLRFIQRAKALGFTLTDIGYNYTDTEVRRIAPNPAVLQQGGLNLLRIGRVELGRLTLGYPKDKLNLGGLLSLGNWEFNLNATRYGEYSVLVGQTPTTPNRDQTFGSKWVLDLKTTYHLDNWSFSLGADNVLNEHPDEVLFANSNGGQFPYNSTSPFGFSGAFVYGSAKISW